jgi:hypothetical protein
LSDGGPYDEQLLVLRAAKTVQYHRDPLRLRIGLVAEDTVDQGMGQPVGGGHVLVGDTGFTVNAQPETHLPVGHGEQRLIGPRQGAAVEGDTERARRGVGRLGHPDDAGQVQAVLGRGARTLEDGEIACDTTPFDLFALRRTGHVIGDREVLRADPLAAQLRHGQAEVHHVPGVVSGRQKHTGVAVCRARHRRGLFGRRRGEDVSDHRPVSETRTDRSAERRVMPRTATDHHRDLARTRLVRTHHTTGHTHDIPGIHIEKPGKHILGKTRRIIEKLCHRSLSPDSLSNR